MAELSLWEFACGHISEGGDEIADACPVCGERDLLRKTPAGSGSLVEEPFDDRDPATVRATVIDQSPSSLRTEALIVLAQLEERVTQAEELGDA